jgi:hypothetical protein
MPGYGATGQRVSTIWSMLLASVGELPVLIADVAARFDD